MGRILPEPDRYRRVHRESAQDGRPGESRNLPADVRRLARGQPPVEWNRDRADERAGVEDLEDPDVVAGEHRHAITCADTVRSARAQARARTRSASSR